MEIRLDRHEVKRENHLLIRFLFGAALIAIGVGIPFVVLYILWGVVGVLYGGLVAVSLILGIIFMLVGQKLIS